MSHLAAIDLAELRTSAHRINPADEFVVTNITCPTLQRQRLAELGIRVGSSIKIVQKAAGGGTVISVDSSRVAIDRSTARGIVVVPST